MSDKKLHPLVYDFKVFINSHPALREEIRKNGRGWQEFYEKWVLLGEEDTYWDAYKQLPVTNEKEPETKEKDTEMFAKLMKMTENLDMEKVQGQVSQLSKTIAMVQEAIGQFQESKKTETRPREPFGWFRD
ncbi:spore coat protein YlbD [Lentibacillus sediminis]|uniref:spore coat protein YlbD n=1 Tax=Lentibacillus sediminis TaxID=1940529 RepID=UPI000C1BFD59|nr:spore coat protein YlbD [Lentibacillus sediminis]